MIGIDLSIEFPQAAALDLAVQVYRAIAPSAVADTTSQAGKRQRAKPIDQLSLEEVSRAIIAKYRISSDKLDPYLRKAMPGGRFNHAYAVRIHVPLKQFYAVQTAKGVGVEVERGKLQMIAHAFGPRIAKLGRNVFRRAGKARLPLSQAGLRGPTVWEMMKKSGVLPKK